MLVKMVPKILPWPVAVSMWVTVAFMAWKSVKVLCAPVASALPLDIGNQDDEMRWRQRASWGFVHALAAFFLATFFTWNLLLVPALLVKIGATSPVMRALSKNALLDNTITSTLFLVNLLWITIWFVRKQSFGGYPFGWFDRSRIREDAREGAKAISPAFFLSILAMVAYRVGVYFLGSLLTKDTASINAFLQQSKMAEGRDWSDSWLFAATTVFLAPVAEEAFYRGLLYRGLRKHWSMEASTGVTALLFAAMHHRFYYFIPTFVMGMIACKVYEERKSLAAPIAFHGIWNVISVGCRFLRTLMR